ncbi:MAG: alpha/beta fold hydrolase BchO [Rubrivivax sp.]
MADAPSALPPWWPQRGHSRFERAGALHWHVQHWGDRRRPLALLLHGTGAGSFSFRHLAPLLARHFEVLAPDLPGHAFTHTPPSQALSLPGVAAALAQWLHQGGRQPALLVGHSAGAAIALQMVLDGAVQPRVVVSINGAILPLRGAVGRWFSPTARLLATNPLVPGAFAAWASLPGVARRLLDSTGSRVDPLGERCYARLVSDPSHAAGALRLMASWALEPLEAALPGLHTPLWLLAAAGDRTLPPAHARRVHALLPHAHLVELPGLGHLAHEEDAEAVAALVQQAWEAAVPADVNSD